MDKTTVSMPPAPHPGSPRAEPSAGESVLTAGPGKAKPLRLLLLEDWAVDAELVLEELSEGTIRFEAKRVVSEAEFLAQLKDFAPELILADYVLPGYDGLAALAAARKQCPDVPFIFVSGALGEETAIEAMHRGATDYVLKHRLSRLRPAVERALREAEERRERLKIEGMLRSSEERLATFAALGKGLSAAKTAREAGEIIIDAADRLFGWDACTFNLYDPDKDRLYHVLSKDVIEGQRAECPATYQGASPSGLARRVLEQGPQLVLKPDAGCRIAGSIPFGDASRPSASAMFVPIHNAARVIGVLSIHSYAPHAYDAADLNGLQRLADHCGGALERIRAQEALTESEAKYRSLVERSPEAILTHCEGRFTFANPAALTLLRAAGPQQLLGRPILEIVPPEFHETIRQRVQQITRRGVVTALLEQTILRLDGTACEVEAIGIPFLREGKPAVQVLMRDVTQQKRMEAQLRQAQKMEAIGQLAGGIAHDFNNILSGTLLHLGLLQMETGLSPKLRNSLKELDAEVQRGARLTRQLLLFSRRQVLQVSQVDLSQVAGDLVKMLRRLVGEHIEVAFEAYGGPAWVEADVGMMEQVVMNLAVNGRDAMPKGGRLAITIQPKQLSAEAPKTHPEARAGSFICLEVTDTGCGMDPAILERVFEPFFTTKEIGRGTGLGLATVHGIVKQHQGWIEVESRVGQGSTFRVLLPAATQPPPAPAPRPAEASRGQNETILLVEDDAVVRVLTSSMLQRLGYRVLEAESAAQALALWQQHQHQVKLVLADMVLPGGTTGLELITRFRQAKPALKAIISSGYCSELTRLGQEFAGQATYLAKPYHGAKLAETVRQCLGS